MIIPDLPVDEKAELSEHLSDYGISQIMLVTPNTSEQRLEEITAKSSGFLYCVSHLGTTGDDRQGVYPGLENYLKRVRKTAGDLPLGLGFGIDGPEKVKK